MAAGAAILAAVYALALIGSQSPGSPPDAAAAVGVGIPALVAAHVAVLWLIRLVWPWARDRSFAEAARVFLRAVWSVVKWEVLIGLIVAGIVSGPVGWLVIVLVWRSRSRSRELRELRAAREALERERARLVGGGEEA